MANMECNFYGLLSDLGLSDYYPGKLTRDHLYQLTDVTLESSKKKDIPPVWQFIHSIVRCNYNARIIEHKDVQIQNISLSGFRRRRARMQTEQNVSIHPLDIIVSVFLCCEATARQDLVMHMWACRLAVPFILRLNKNSPVSVYLWPLRSLIVQVIEKTDCFDRQLIKEKISCLGFIRVGENDAWSKSYLLDCLIWGPDKTHSTFIHRDSEGSRISRSCIVEGLVEIAWHLLSDKVEKGFSDPKLLLNLRGDARNHVDQTKIIGQLSSVTVILTTLNDLSACVSVVKTLIEEKSRVIILLSDKKSDTEELSTLVNEFFWDIPEDELEFLELGQKRLPEVLKFIYFNINQMEQQICKKFVLSDFVKNISSMSALVDETDNIYKEAFESAKDILIEILKLDDDIRKSTLFPLQENYWKDWAQKERDYHRFHQLDDNKRKTLHVESTEQLKAQLDKIRSDQYDYVLRNGISKPIDIFIQTLNSFAKSEKNGVQKRKVFLRCLKLELDNLSRNQLTPFNKKYQDLINKSAGAKENEKDEINKTLSELDAAKSSMSFGIENIFRELGQIYEACEFQNQKKSVRLDDRQTPIKQYKKLPRLMCYSLTDGYPFEILDGEARSIPPSWTKAVLSELDKVLCENDIYSTKPAVHIHVLSVLGIQSSGKSTLLNIMFGLQYPVSAGRCTRGAFMQLVKVHESLSALLGEDIDYIAVIDTEGLRTAALSSAESVKHDNELSTFVIGLAHTTVINLMGENATYLQENLPIVVQAFLRMYLVHLHPRCMIVHHNVDKRNREKMLQQGLILQSVLDHLTKQACETEKVPQKTFRDIIAFNVVEHTCYIPSLLDGVLPMAPVSLGYSFEADCTRKKLIAFLKQDSVQNTSCKYTIKRFSDHLFHLWNAILKDNFLYEYRTTTEVALRIEIDKTYLNILLELTKDVDRSVSKATKEIERGKDITHELSQLEKNLNKTIQKHQETFEAHFESQKKTTPYLPDQWKSEYIACLNWKYQNLLKESKAQITDYGKFILGHNRPTKKEIKDFFEKCQQLSFEDVWLQFKPDPAEATHDVYLSDAHEALKDVCFSTRHLLQLNFSDSSSLSDFTISNKHINHPFEKFTDVEIVRLTKLMEEITTTIAKEYEYEILQIKNESRIISYSSRIPKRILLRVEKNLNARLHSEDSMNGISNQFKIDLLSCVAKSCISDMERIFKRKYEVELESMRYYLQSCIFSEKKLENSFSMALFELMGQSIRHNFTSQVSHFILHGLNRSTYNQDISSKCLLIGGCLIYFIKNERDDMMIEYIRDPKSALREYLCALVNTYISKSFLENDLQFYIRLAIDNVWRAFEDVGFAQKTNVSLKDIIKTVLVVTDLPSIIKKAASVKLNRIVKGNKTLDFKSLKDIMLHYVESFIEKEVLEQRQVVLENQDENACLLADKLLEGLVGCLHRCRVCKEICLLSEEHQSRHICLHRLTYRDTDFCKRSGDIAYIWKWLNFHKYDVLAKEGLNMITSVPEEWQYITEKEVINDIKHRLGITQTSVHFYNA